MNGPRLKKATRLRRVQIRAVTFDVGGTLIEPWPSVGHVYAEVAARHGFTNISPDLLNARFRTAWNQCKPFEHARAGWEVLVDEVFLGLCEPPSRTFFPELYHRFSEPDAWRVFEDVVPALQALASRNVKLGVVSNWDERLRGLLRVLKLHEHFEVFAISCEIGFPKPSRAIFDEVALKLALPANAVLHVGDSVEMDFVGARAAGFHALRINRTAGKPDPETITSLAEVPRKIEDFERP